MWPKRYYPPKERKEFLQAACSIIHGEELSNAQVSDADDEKENEDAESVTSHASQLYTEIEVAASEFYEDYNNDGYGEEYNGDCTSAMNVVPLERSATILDEDVKKCDITTASIVKPRKGNPAEKNNWKYQFKASGKTRSHPQVPPEDKECLATYIKVGDLNAWTLWDSGSTTLGITPHYAEVANIVVNTLSDPHILQLGTVGSRSIIKFGADTTLTIGGQHYPSYVDVANFDRYDMIIGTPFMCKNGVILDFNDNCVVINSTRWPATKVERKGNDPGLRCY